jgi:hypothetical protein
MTLCALRLLSEEPPFVSLGTTPNWDSMSRYHLAPLVTRGAELRSSSKIRLS